MSAPTRVQAPHHRGKVVSYLIVAACVLACTLPIIGGLLAGTFVDGILDSPALISLLVGVATATAIAFSLMTISFP